MRLPDFLIIGAMKAGSTTLYRDLLTNPGIAFPADKELGKMINLTSDEVLSDAGRTAYADHFRGIPSDLIAGEASTHYTKLPDRPGVAERAKAVVPASTKIIYLVREPVSRIVSHHHHELTSGSIQIPDLERALHEVPRLLDFTRYAMQVEPWIEAFGPGNVRVVRFEDYVADRPGQSTMLSEWLGAPPHPELVQIDKVFNRSADKPVRRGPFAWIPRNPVYRKLIRPLVPVGAKDHIRQLVFPKPKQGAQPPSSKCIDVILNELASDHERLSTLMGIDGPVWDASSVRAKYAQSSRKPAA